MDLDKASKDIIKFAEMGKKSSSEEETLLYNTRLIS